MVKRCVVQGCGKIAKDGVSLHKFPINQSLKKLWVKFIKTHRKNFDGPSEYSFICSRHFRPEDFQENAVKAALGFKSGKPKLKEDAVPTLSYKHLALEEPTQTKRSAYRRRLCNEVLQEAVKDQPEPRSASPNAVNVDTSHECGTDPPETFSTSMDTAACIAEPKKKDFKVQFRASSRSKGVQCQPRTQSVGIQCNLIKPIHQSSPCVSDNEIESDDEDDVDMNDCYEPELEEELDFDSDDSTSDSSYCTDDKERKFIVFESALLQLFAICVACHNACASAFVTAILGTLIVVEQKCKACGHKWRWTSQERIGNIPAGNLLLSSAILFTGALPRKTLRVFKVMGVAVISPATFFIHQKRYLHAAVQRVWEHLTDELLEQLKGSDLILGGDGRNDSMGHCAKYGTYTLMELNANKIIYITTVQSNEVKGSCHMELEGLKRGLQYLTTLGHSIKALVTDQHMMIQKFMRETYATILHYYDVWHVAKGLKKKLSALSKKTGFSLVTLWMRSIINHLYWCASSSSANSSLVSAKWFSICNHLQNKHSGHDDPLYPECTHETLKKKWFDPGDASFEKLCDILENTYLKKAVAKLSPYGQTSNIEGFHSVINHYSPKMYHFSYQTMLSRTRIAALHYNENSSRPQALNRNGEAEYSIQFPKAKSGGYVVRKLKDECTYDYIDLLHDELFAVVGMEPDVSEIVPPPPLCSTFVRPDKAEAVSQLYSRFEKATSSVDD